MTNPAYFTYFVVRVRIDGPGAVAGVVERLGTGRKQSFQEGHELLRILADWSNAPSKMPAAPETGNESPQDRGRS